MLGAKSAIDVIKSNDDDKYELKWENVFFSDLVEEFGSVRQRAGLGWQALLRRCVGIECIVFGKVEIHRFKSDLYQVRMDKSFSNF